MVKLPREDYFKFGNPFTGSYTTVDKYFNYLVKFDETFICKTWYGLVNSEKAEDVTEKQFENLDEIPSYIEKLMSEIIPK